MKKSGWKHILGAIGLGFLASLISLILLLPSKPIIALSIFVYLVVGILLLLSFIFLIIGIVLLVVSEVDFWRGNTHVDEKEKNKIPKNFNLENILKIYQNIDYEIAMDKDKISQWTIDVVSEITGQKIKIVKNDLSISYIGNEIVYIGANQNTNFIFGSFALKINEAK